MGWAKGANVSLLPLVGYRAACLFGVLRRCMRLGSDDTWRASQGVCTNGEIQSDGLANLTDSLAGCRALRLRLEKLASLDARLP